MTTKSKVFLTILFGLAALGIIQVIQTNPLMLLVNILLAFAIVYFLSRFLSTRGEERDKGYQKALKAQKKKEKLDPHSLLKLTRLKKHPSDVPLKVIDGRKTKNAKEKQRYFH